MISLYSDRIEAPVSKTIKYLLHGYSLLLGGPGVGNPKGRLVEYTIKEF